MELAHRRASPADMLAKLQKPDALESQSLFAGPEDGNLPRLCDARGLPLIQLDL